MHPWSMSMAHCEAHQERRAVKKEVKEAFASESRRQKNMVVKSEAHQQRVHL